ncbi:MAG: hypothetical protein IIY44_06585 [Erysipelotrichales bacterium]|nr:hypothetical protein [Erysipelotrichales bacterium]MBQ1385328.1 hypothetical protein [Erysipelotrichales bacterium]MBQ2310758.1 hypothetical protein [Erysipelotrichales bacterium]MBQ2478617.1 hypothetical protein [Erysipelotrichales bacterium]MBQ4011135.1 hypothetical protein [Erysipelotrichales bacterium]
MNFVQILTALALVGGLAVLNGWIYVKNKKTPLPEGCEPFRESCSNCPAEEDCVLKKVERSVKQ